MEDDEDDIYAPEDILEEKPDLKPELIAPGDAMDEDEVEEEEEDESDSDIEIVTEQKEPTTDASKLSSRAPPRPETSTPAPASTTRAAPTTTNAPSPPPNQKPGSSYPAVRTSTLDIDAKPTHPLSGKPITELDIDTDLPDEKSWRIPGSDQTDYFNYGFDEFTWAAYCLKQTTLRAEAKEQKKALGEFQNMFGGSTAPASMGAGGVGGMGGGNGMGNNAAVANPVAGNMMAGFPGEIPPEMVPAMQAMMASGMDPSQMDMGAFMQMMGGGNAGQGFGGQGVAGMGGGYDAYGGQGHGGRGGRRGRGRW